MPAVAEQSSVGEVLKKKLTGLLTKMGVEDPGRLSMDRAKKKLGRRLADPEIMKGVELTDEEIGLVEGLGFEVPGRNGDGVTATTAEDDNEPADETEKVVEAKAVPKAKAGKATTKSKSSGKEPKIDRSTPKKSGSSGLAMFQKMFEVSPGPVLKEAIITKLTKAGVNEGTARSYIAWAKRPTSNKKKNPFGFRVVESLDDKGKKVITRK